MSKKQAAPEKGVSQTQIWIATIAAVAIIIGLAVMVSSVVKSRGGPSPQPAPVAVAESPAPAPVQTPPPPEPAPQRADSTVAPLVPIAPVRPAVVDTRPALVMDRLAGTVKVTSAGIMDNGRLNLEHTCYRRGKSMPVLWTGVPSSAKSLVLVVEEHRPGEAPRVKWLAYNIPADARGLPAALPQAEAFEGGIRQGQNDHGTVGYTGPCIPRGQIDYKLRLFALDTVLDVTAPIKFDGLIPLMNGHVVDATELPFIHYLKL